MTDHTSTARPVGLIKPRSLAVAFVTLTLPLLLILFNSRLVMTPLFLQFEYTRPDFPEDFYGLTQTQRLEYAPYALNYLLNGADIRYLGDLHFDDGSPLFNARELNHMRDVKHLTQILFGLALVTGVLVIGILYRLRGTARLRMALMRGSMLTLGLIAAVAVVATMNWDFFFTGFHQLFFQNGTWYFAYSDTLIRLFPEQFWFDAALVIAGLSIFEALVILLGCWRFDKLWGK